MMHIYSYLRLSVCITLTHIYICINETPAERTSLRLPARRTGRSLTGVFPDKVNVPIGKIPSQHRLDLVLLLFYPLHLLRNADDTTDIPGLPPVIQRGVQHMPSRSSLERFPNLLVAPRLSGKGPKEDAEAYLQVTNRDALAVDCLVNIRPRRVTPFDHHVGRRSTEDLVCVSDYARHANVRRDGRIAAQVGVIV